MGLQPAVPPTLPTGGAHVSSAGEQETRKYSWRYATCKCKCLPDESAVQHLFFIFSLFLAGMEGGGFHYPPPLPHE